MAECGSDGGKRVSVGILRWEAGPKDLSQFEEIPGHLLHPATFEFPVRYKRVTGASFETVVRSPSASVLRETIRMARELEEESVRAITTSCGFNAIFQKELAASVSVPVFTSSLLQVPLVHRMAGEGRIGILTADEESLTQGHLRTVGIDASIPIAIAGVQDTHTFSSIRDDPGSLLDIPRFREEVLGVVGRRLVERHADMRAIVIECTDLAPFSADIKKATRLPVFDIITLTRWVYHSIV